VSPRGVLYREEKKMPMPVRCVQVFKTKAARNEYMQRKEEEEEEEEKKGETPASHQNA
jgi:hypothetical protein